jgi:trans-aconitate 2-methyltransferase
VRDLLNAVPGRDVVSAIDLGCGPGNSTEVLVAICPGASVSGLDSSADMIEAARKRLPKCQFAVKSIETWNGPGPFDIILANASLHWVPNHASLLERFVEFLSEHGGLAIRYQITSTNPRTVNA